MHASGFLTRPSPAGPEQAARDLLGKQGAAFGVTPGQRLVLRQAPPAGAIGPVRFERQVNGLPVFNADLVVGVDGEGGAFLVNATEVGSELSGSHAMGEDAAAEAALASFGTGARAAGKAAIEKGYRTNGSLPRAVYRVDFIGQQPAGDWRVFIDGETGAVLSSANIPGSCSKVNAASSAFNFTADCCSRAPLFEVLHSCAARSASRSARS